MSREPIIPALDKTIAPRATPLAAGRTRDRRWPTIFTVLTAGLALILGYNLLIGWGWAVLNLREATLGHFAVLALFTAIPVFLFWKVHLAMRTRAVLQGRVRCASHHLRAVVESYEELARRRVKERDGRRTEIDFCLDLHLVDPPFSGRSASTTWTSRRGASPRIGSVEEVLVETRAGENGEPVPQVHGLTSDFDESYAGGFFFFLVLGLIAMGLSFAARVFSFPA